jgi:hypothetical protein
MPFALIAVGLEADAPTGNMRTRSSNTFAGIRPTDAPGFMVVQMVVQVVQITGALAATALFRWLAPATPESAEELLVPHPHEEKRPVHA